MNPPEVAPAPPPDAPPTPTADAPLQPGVADQILGMLRNVEPFKTVLDKLLKNTRGADAALRGEQPPLPPPGAQAPTVLDPTVRALRDGTSGRIPNQ